MASVDLSSYRDQHFKVRTQDLRNENLIIALSYVFRAPEVSRRDC